MAPSASSVTLLASLVLVALASGAWARPEWYDENVAASYARYILNNEKTGVLATFSAADPSFPFSSVEDFSDDLADSGMPLFVLPSISSSSRNIHANNNASLSVYVANCTKGNYDEMPYDAMACYRFTVSGQMVPVEGDLSSPNMAAFAKRHPAVEQWISSGSHTYHLFQLKPARIYYVGGYGNLHYIGPIDVATYLAAKPQPPE